MNNKKTILWLISIAIIISASYFIINRIIRKQTKQHYKTATFEKREIEQLINATGSIEAKDTIRVGSLINGVVKELYVEENEQVKKGQIIALLDNGKGDTDVQRTLGLLNRAKARLTYQKKFLDRQQKLYANGHISLDLLQQAQAVYGEAKGTYEESTASYEKAFIDYENIKILSPINGIIIKKNVSLGQGVSSFLAPTVLYLIAKDLKKMKIELEVDETSIGDLRVGQEALLTFDTYAYHVFEGNIKEISNGPTIAKGTVSYKAYIYIDNEELLLKPGMTVRAEIIVNKKEDVLAIPGYIFAINPKLIEFVAEEIGYGFKPITKEQMAEFKKEMQDKENPIKKIWIVKDKAFIEKLIEIGITDKIFFEVIKGLTGDEDIVIDVEETDVMKEMFKRLFGGGFKKK